MLSELPWSGSEIYPPCLTPEVGELSLLLSRAERRQAEQRDKVQGRHSAPAWLAWSVIGNLFVRSA